MKILMVSGNFLPMSAPGAAYVAGAALDAGHEVEIFDCFIAGEDPIALETHLDKFDPDVVALSIPMAPWNIPDGNFGFVNRIADTRPIFKSLVRTVKRKSDALIILGGGGFNYFSTDWLEYLELDYGIIGEGEVSFPLFLSKLSQNESVSGVSGVIVRHSGRVGKAPLNRIKDLDTIGMPAYHLFDTAQYNELGISWAIQSKRGCSLGCSHCSHSIFEGQDYRLKSPSRIIEEIIHVVGVTGSNHINFCDNSFNCPLPHAKSVCREIMDQQLDVQWRSGTFKPLGFSRQFCDLLKESGCSYVGVSLGTASARMLANMNSRYTIPDIRSALDHLSEADMDFGVSLLLGAPGETLASIQESLSVLDDYPDIKAVWVNIGIFGWGHTLKEEKIGMFKSLKPLDSSLFQGANYISPELDSEDMIDMIDALNHRKNYLVQINKPWAG
ncbi:MAG: radical SAM protein [Desulfobacteraceae bacterium]|nr:radical SAM protein [Desulfobacteraceae bacterium]